MQNAESDVLAFLDADETVDEDWLETALGAMQEQDVDYLGCNVELTCPEDTLVGRYNARTGFPVEEYLEDQNYAPTCALLVRRKVFEDVGPFDARLISGGDREFGDRVHDAGYEQGYAENATVYHPARTSSNLSRRRTSAWGVGSVKNNGTIRSATANQASPQHRAVRVAATTGTNRMPA